MAIQDELAKAFAPRRVIIETTPLRNVALPVQLAEAIEQKQKADQESQRMEFILRKEKQEADSKRIEAKGIADSQTILAAGIGEQLLGWKGIEATEKLADSPNTKVIIVGAGERRTSNNSGYEFDGSSFASVFERTGHRLAAATPLLLSGGIEE